MIRNLTRFILGMGLVVLLTNTSNAQWVQIDSNRFVGAQKMCLAVSGSNISAGTDSGVFLSTDSGTSWARCNSGFLPLLRWVDGLAVGGSYSFASLIVSNCHYMAATTFRNSRDNQWYTTASESKTVCWRIQNQYQQDRYCRIVAGKFE